MGQTYKNFGSLLSCYFVRALILKRARPFIRDISAWIISKKLFWHFVLFMYMSTSSFHSNQSPILYRRFRKIIIMAWYWNKPIYLILDLIGTSQHISKFVARGIRTGDWGGGGVGLGGMLISDLKWGGWGDSPLSKSPIFFRKEKGDSNPAQFPGSAFLVSTQILSLLREFIQIVFSISKTWIDLY